MAQIIDRKTAVSALIKRDKDAHKYSVGSLMSICGSYGMAGAGILSGKAAMRSGAGLLRMVVPQEIYPVMATSIYEAVYSIMENKNDFSFLENINKHRCVLMGCGLSTSDYAKNLVYKVLEKCEVPLVLDADALNIIAENPQVLKSAKASLIITPHNMEMARLMNVSVKEIIQNREKIATEFSKEFSVITVLKGAETFVADPDGKVMVNNLTGNSGMAVAGSGDVLAGIISALVCQGGDLYNSACGGVYIHGLAGDIAKEKYGEISMLPTDIIDCLPQAFMTVSNI